MNPERVEESAWGTWADAERWRREAFRRRTPEARLAWLEDAWLLTGIAGTCKRPDETRPGGPED
jgi:hypothetical protein